MFINKIFFQIFSDLRSDLDCHLYADVLPCLDWIRSLNIKTGVFTNSNAVVSKDSILGSKLDIYMHAGEIGGSKPSPVPFLALSQRLQVNPGRVLYVGDSYHHDVVGAHLAGMKSAYLRREADICDRTFESMFARYGIQPDITLNSLHPEEFEEKLASLALLP